MALEGSHYVGTAASNSQGNCRKATDHCNDVIKDTNPMGQVPKKGKTGSTSADFMNIRTKSLRLKASREHYSRCRTLSAFWFCVKE